MKPIILFYAVIFLCIGNISNRAIVSRFAPTTPEPVAGTSGLQPQPTRLPVCSIDDAEFEEVESGDEDEEIVFENEEQAEVRNRVILNARSVLFDGPTSPEETRSILKRALELFDQPKKRSRTHQHDEQARGLLELMTGERFPGNRLLSIENPDDPDYCPMEDSKFKTPRHIFSMETMRKIVHKKEVENRSHDSLKKLYPRYNKQDYNWIKECVSKGEVTKSKRTQVEQFVLEQVKSARDRLGPLHGRMLQRWALQRAREINMTGFMASKGWLSAFMKRNRLVSRKITKYRSRSEFEKDQSRKKSIEDFHKYYAYFKQFMIDERIWNFDQVGFNYENANLRTISYEGERDTLLHVDDKNKVTHSYTAQPLISRDGRLIGPMFICLQEARGQFGPRVMEDVRRQVEEYGNVYVLPSKSGKLSSELFQNWFDNVLVKIVRLQENFQDESVRNYTVEDSILDDIDNMCYDEVERSVGPAEAVRGCRWPINVLLLADSWGGHSSNSMLTHMRTAAGARILKIPPGTTDLLQPLDVGFNRQYKKLWKRIEEEAWAREMIRNVTSRSGIINIQSLMRDQLGAPAYADMIRWAWHQTDKGFDETQISRRPIRKVDDINFKFKSDEKCIHNGCNEYAFIRCAHCGRHLCLQHFLERHCFHGSGSNWQTEDNSFRQTYDFEVANESLIEPYCRPFDDSGNSVSSTTDSTRDQVQPLQRLPVEIASG